MSDDFRKPAAFILEGEEAEPAVRSKARQKPAIEFDLPDPNQELVTVPAAAAAPRRRLPLLSILLSALAALVALGAGLAITQLIEDLYARSQAFGWIGLAIAATAGLAALAIIIREAWGIARLNRIEHIQEHAARALNLDYAAAAKQVVEDLSALYSGRGEARWGLQEYGRHKSDIMDPKDRIELFDKLVLEPLDQAAHRIIARRARRVTVLTTVTPAAALDLLFVAAQNLGMLRELADLYGGRPSTLSTLKLARMVVSHLAVTGGIALSDNLLQHVVGKGLLGRLSARFGEGAVNGIMTSRIGLAAREVCRPVPQPPSKRETLAGLLRELVNFSPPPGNEPPRG
jgi:putative membrane protein